MYAILQFVETQKVVSFTYLYGLNGDESYPFIIIYFRETRN